jgi:hypothetical protein
MGISRVDGEPSFEEEAIFEKDDQIRLKVDD